MSLLRPKNILILGIIIFLIMSFWSLYSMPIGENGKMVNCPFMNGLAILCQMNLTEHIAQWQQLFTIIKEKSLFLLSLVLPVFIPVALFTITMRTYDKQQFQRLRHYLYQYKPEIKLFDNFLLAFSQGIINPKVYEAIF